RPPVTPRGAGSRSAGAAVRVPRGVLGDAFVVADHLGDDEVQELLGEGRVEPGVLGEVAQPGDLAGLAGRVGGRQPVLRLEAADLLGALEAFGEHVDDGGVDVVDAVAQPGEFLAHGGVDVRGAGGAGGHGASAYGPGPGGAGTVRTVVGAPGRAAGGGCPGGPDRTVEPGSGRPWG